MFIIPSNHNMREMLNRMTIWTQNLMIIRLIIAPIFIFMVNCKYFRVFIISAFITFLYQISCFVKFMNRFGCNICNAIFSLGFSVAKFRTIFPSTNFGLTNIKVFSALYTVLIFPFLSFSTRRTRHRTIYGCFQSCVKVFFANRALSSHILGGTKIAGGFKARNRAIFTFFLMRINAVFLATLNTLLHYHKTIISQDKSFVNGEDLFMYARV